MGRSDLVEFAKLLDSADYAHDGNVVYKNVTVNWEIDVKNCLLLSNQYTVDDETKPSEIIVSFEIQIHDWRTITAGAPCWFAGGDFNNKHARGRERPYRA